MGNEKKDLQKAFSLKEKNENLLTNLENLKNGGTLSEDQYSSIKMGYVNSLTEAKTAVEQIKQAISQNILAEEQNAQMLDMELKNIAVRFQTGELKIEETQRSRERISKKIQQSNDKVTDLKRLFHATNSSEVGGYMDTRPGTAFKAGSPTSGVSFPDPGALISSIRGTSASDFTEIRTDIHEITGSSEQLIGPIGGFLLLISLFLPWVSFLGFSVSLMNSSGFDAIIGLILALAGIGSAFLARDKARGTLQFFAGITAIGWMVISMVLTVTRYGSFMLNLTLQILGIGFFLYIIGALIMIVGGIMELKND